MKFITVSELRGNATRIVHEVEQTGEEVIITRNGRPVALIRKVEQDEFTLKGGRAEGGRNG
jgi:prevent-host-death family protein